MRIDMHVHAAGNGRRLDRVDDDVFFKPEDNHHWFTRIVYSLMESDLLRLGADTNHDGVVSTSEYFDLLCRLLAQSQEIDGLVLLAMDAVFAEEDGALDEVRTDLWVSNRFLWRTVQRLNSRLAEQGCHKRFFFGASVSPNRRDWEEELGFVLNQTDAVLLKLIPSAQHIRLNDARHDPFFDCLVAGGLPILCHVGPEYSFPDGLRRRRLDDFVNLERALDRGVTVIAGHCASPLFPVIDRDDVGEFARFMQSANGDGTVRLWADTSALTLTPRIPVIPRILEVMPAEWLVNGSDFPVPVDCWAHLPWLTHDVTPAEYLTMWRTKNPIDRDVVIKRAMGFADSILDNAVKVLRMPPGG